MERLRWAVRLHADPIYQQSWFVLTALSRLREQGLVALSVKAMPVPVERSAWLEVEDVEQKIRRTVNVDLSDFGWLTTPNRAELADVTLKRSYDETQLDEHLARKVRPLGLAFACTSGLERLPRLYWLSVARALRSVPITRRARAMVRAAHVQQMTRRVARSRGTRSTSLPGRLDELEGVSGGGEARVVYQVRAWDPALGINPLDREQVNEQRAGLIEALRRELGPRFVGGFQPQPYARQRFPALLSESPTTKSGYLALVRDSSIGVSTRGLHRSNPWKLPEYFAAGRAVVTEELHFTVPQPLEHGTDALVFRTNDECVAACLDLLEDKAQRAMLQENASRYYERVVRPDAQLSKHLSEVFTNR